MIDWAELCPVLPLGQAGPSLTPGGLCKGGIPAEFQLCAEIFSPGLGDPPSWHADVALLDRGTQSVVHLPN